MSEKSFLSPNLDTGFWTRLVPGCLAFGLLLSIATHVRYLTGGVLGPGEVMLTLLALLGWLIGRPWLMIKSPIVLFWSLMALTLFLGSEFGSLKGMDVQRDIQAYFFTASVSIGLVALMHLLTNASLRRVVLYLCVFSVVALWLGFLIYMSNDSDLIRLVWLNDSGDLRYNGWSKNPNQLALFFIPLPVWITALWRDVLRPTWAQRIGYGFLLLALMLMGLLIRSDGLFVVWALEFVVLLLLRLRWDAKSSRLSILSYALAMVLCVLAVKIFAFGDVRKSLQCSVRSLGQGLQTWQEKCYDQASQNFEFFRIGYNDPAAKLGLREDHWLNAIKAWKQSPIVGHGPGAFSWMPDTPLNELGIGQANVEAHNIPLDLATQGGGILAAAWCALLLYLLVGAWRIRDSYTFSTVLMVGVFGMFHYVIRQPYLWFILIMAYEAIQRRLFVSLNQQ